MTAKEYLNQARTLDMLINAKIEELHNLKLMAVTVSSPALSEKVKSSKENNSMCIVDKIIDLQNTINDEVDKLVNLKKEIRSKIDMLSDPFEKVVLIERYINCKSWEDISEKIHYEMRNTQYLHKKALQHFAPFCIDLHSINEL